MTATDQSIGCDPAPRPHVNGLSSPSIRWLYLDQFVLSKMVDHERKPRSDTRVWGELRERLEPLVVGGQYSCPVSPFHLTENRDLADGTQGRIRLASTLSGGVAFRPPGWIVAKSVEFRSAADPASWLETNFKDIAYMPTAQAVEHMLTCPSWRQATICLTYGERYRERIQVQRWKEWRERPVTDFNELTKEGMDFARRVTLEDCIMVRPLLDPAKSCPCGDTPTRAAAFGLTLSAGKAVPLGSIDQIEWISEAIADGVLERVPFFDIYSRLSAALVKAAQSGAGMPKSTIWNDIEIIAAYAPFVDEMLVDNFCADLVKKAKLKVGCRFTTPKTIASLIERLNAAETCGNPAAGEGS